MHQATYRSTRNTDGGAESALYIRNAIVRNEPGQAPTVAASGAAPIIVETAGAVAWNATVVIIGEDVVVQMTGGVGQVVAWQTYLDGIQIGPF